MTNEDKKLICEYMGWQNRPTCYDLNDAALVVQEMQKRGEWVYFYDDLLDTYNGLCEDGKVSCGAENFSAWLFNSENFFKAFVEWRKTK